MQDSMRKAYPGRLLRRSFVLTCLASLLFCSQTRADTTVVLSFAQAASPPTKTLTVNGDGSASLTGADIPVVITQFGGFSSFLPAFENVTASSDTNTATLNPITGAISQPFSGTVSFTSGPGGTGTNFLTATFTNVTMISTNNLGGTNGSPSASLTAAQPPQILTLTSDLLPPSLLTPPVSMSISLSLNSALTFIPSSPGSTTGTITPGTYSVLTEQGGIIQSPSAVPEPSSFLVAGIGGLGLIGYGLRRRKAMAA